MRNYLLAIGIALLFFSCKNDPAIDAAFSKYNHRNGIVSITVPGFLIKTATLGNFLEPDEEQLLRHIDKVKVLSVEDTHAYQDVNFYKEFKSLIDHEAYTELLNVKSHGDDIRIFAKIKKKDKINDLIILTNGNDKALIYVKGDFTVEQLAAVANKSSKHNSETLRNILNFQ